MNAIICTLLISVSLVFYCCSSSELDPDDVKGGADFTQSDKSDGGPDSRTNISNSSCKSKVCKGIEVESAQDLEALSGCTLMKGDLNTYQLKKEIDDLNDLSCLETIDGNLIIDGENITSISGLNRLISVTKSLLISSPLLNLDGLDNLRIVGGALDINCKVLSDLDGLGSLTTIGDSLYIYNCHHLQGLDGLGGLKTIGGDLTIGYCHNLQNLDGLNSLSSVGGMIRVVRLPSLSTCDVYDFLKRTGFGEIVEDNGINKSTGEAVVCGTKEDDCGSNLCPPN